MFDVTHSRGTVLRIIEENVVSVEKVGSHHQKVPLVEEGGGEEGGGGKERGGRGEGEGERGEGEGKRGEGRGGEEEGRGGR